MNINNSINNFFTKRQTRKLHQKIKYYWGQTAYIKNDKRLLSMQKYMRLAQTNFDSEKYDDAFQALFLAKREHMLARTKGQVYYYRSGSGIIWATIFTIIFSLGILAFWLLRDELVLGLYSQIGLKDITTESLVRTFSPFLAALAGGIGGCAAVLIQAIDVTPESEVVSKTGWYFAKPVLGAALGIITYYALVSGLNLITNGAEINSFAGAILIGFLAGFFESFSTGILSKAAGQLISSDPPEKEDD